MRFVDRIAAPSKERIIEQHTGVELLEIIAKHARQAERGGEEPSRLRHQVKTCRISRAHDHRQSIEGLGLKPKLFDHGIKCATLTPVVPEHVVDIKRNAAKAIGHAHHFGRVDEEEHR